MTATEGDSGVVSREGLAEPAVVTEETSMAADELARDNAIMGAAELGNASALDQIAEGLAKAAESLQHPVSEYRGRPPLPFDR